jgi:flagellar basal body-associated protein FliL
MKKKKLIIISIAITVVILVGGILGGVVYAQSGSTTTTSSTTTSTTKDTLFAKVAAILGIDEAKLQSAFSQAQEEIKTDALNNRLQELVVAGKLTQEEADQYLKWWQSQPTLPDGINLPGLHRNMMPGCFQMHR